MNRDFFLLWQGQLVSQLGSQLCLIGFILWVKHATNSGLLIGLIAVMSSLPGILMAPIGGSFADRHSRRRILVVCDLLDGVAMLFLAVLVWNTPEAMRTILVCLMIAIVYMSVVGSFFRPAIFAAVPDLIPKGRLQEANSLIGSSVQMTVLIGQGLGGVLFCAFGFPVLLLVNGVSFLFSAISELFVRIPQRITERSTERKKILDEFKIDITEGFRYVSTFPGLKQIIIAASLFTFFTTPIVLLLPFYVEDFLKVTPDWLGFLLAAFGLGSLAGYAIAGTVKVEGQRKIVLISTTLAGESLVIMAMALVPIAVVSLLLAVISGVLLGIFNVFVNTILQKNTPSEMRGRVFGFMSALSGALAPVSMVIAGVAVDLLDHRVQIIYILSGCGLLMLSVVLPFKPEVQEYLTRQGPVSLRADNIQIDS